MNQIVKRAIDASAETLQRRPLTQAAWTTGGIELPSAIAEFLEHIGSGILFPVTIDDRQNTNGFEILDSTLLWSVNELLGEPPTPDRPCDYFDNCRVIFASVDDQFILIGVDLNEEHYGWIFISTLYPGNSPYECSEYQAKSFEEWLELNLKTYDRNHSKQWTMKDIPKLGPVGDGCGE